MQAPIKIDNGINIVISNQWGENIIKFIKKSEELGYIIEPCITKEIKIENSSMKINEIIIGNQIWMDKNLSVDTFQNGDSIKEAKTNDEWKKALENGEPAWCCYENYPSNGDKYGKIYNGFAVADSRGLAPKGWHIPDEIEYINLCEFLGGINTAGIKLKSIEDWIEHPIQIARRNGTNESGFTGLPGGYRNNDGEFRDITKDCSLWNSLEFNNKIGYVSLNYAESSLVKGYLDKEYGFYVRCLKD